MTGRTIQALALVAGLAVGTAATSGIAAIQTTPRTPPPGEGVLCAMAIINAIAEVGRTCFPGRDPEYQAELGRSVARIDEYVLRNSTMTAADVTRFKRDQSLLGAPASELCHGDYPPMYEEAVARGTAVLRSETDRMLARPGQPTFGDCL